MTYVNLRSFQGVEELQRALEAPAIKRIADGSLRLHDVLGMGDRDALMAFQIIRFPNTHGIPTCPHCQSKDPYETNRQVRRWRCAHCGKDFSLTSGTMLHGRKLGFRSYLALLAVTLDKHRFNSLLRFSKETGIDYKTTWNRVRQMRAAVTNSNGCTVPFSLLDRETFQQRFNVVAQWLGQLRPPPSEMNWPYLDDDKKDSNGADLLLFVNNHIPRGLPDYLRADIAQDIILAILEGQTTREQISLDARKYILQVFQQYPWKYKWISFDAPIFDDGTRSLHDAISAQSAAEFWERERA
jgi:transposase-like protein